MVRKKVSCARELKLLLGVFVCLLLVNFVLGEAVSYSANEIKIGYSDEGDVDVSGYDNCIASPYKINLPSSSNDGFIVNCWYDVDNKLIRTDSTNDVTVGCSYVCTNGEEIDRNILMELESYIRGETSSNKLIGKDRECITFIRGLARDNHASSTTSYSCKYDSDSGDLITKCEGDYCGDLDTDYSLGCGYICLGEGLIEGDEIPRIEMEQFLGGALGTRTPAVPDRKYIGKERNCISSFRGRKVNEDYFRNDECNYYSGEGFVIRGVTGTYGEWFDCNYFCTDGPVECGDGIDNDGDGEIDALVEGVVSFTIESKTAGFVDTGPWRHYETLSVYSRAPALVLGSLNPGNKITVSNIGGTISYGSASGDEACSTGARLGFYAGQSLVGPEYTLGDFVGEGISVPLGASSLYTYLIEEGSMIDYANNDGTCTFDVKDTSLPDCSDGIDNDDPVDGKFDFCDGSNSGTCDLGCDSANDDSEIPHDTDCDSFTDDSEACVPDCLDKECGDDGCGGSCGICDDGDPGTADSCVSNLCQNILIGTAVWRDMNGMVIGTGFGDLDVEVEDTVLMVLQGSGLTEGDSVTFEVYEADLVGDDDIRTVANGNAIIGIVDAEGNAIGKWKATSEDLVGEDLSSAEFIFKVNGLESNELVIGEVPDNNILTTEIINPIEESNYTLDSGTTEVIGFNQSSTDVDDDLKVVWKFGDGSSLSFFNCLTTGNCNTTYQYISNGTKVITLIANETTRGQSARDFSRIYVYGEGFNVFAIIDEPDYRDPFASHGPVLINGSSSYVAKCFATSEECEIAKPGECYSVASGSKSLYCYRFAESDALTFEWKIDGVIPEEAPVNQDQFIHSFIIPDDHEVTLKVTHPTIGVDNTFVILKINSGGIQCSDSGEEWLDYGFFPTIIHSSSLDDCRRGFDICCPGASFCDETNKCSYNGVEFCNQLGTDTSMTLLERENECEFSSDIIAKASIEAVGGSCGIVEGSQVSTPEVCWDENDCSCEWEGGTNECVAKLTNVTKCISSPDVENDICRWKLNTWEDRCEAEGVIEATWTAEQVLGVTEGCEDKSKLISCEAIVKLPFFDSMNFIMVVFSIIGIYGFSLKFNKKIK